MPPYKTYPPADFSKNSFDSREIKHDIIRQMAGASFGFHFVTFLSNSKINPSGNREKITHSRQTQTYSFSRTNGRRQGWNFCCSREKQTPCLLRVFIMCAFLFILQYRHEVDMMDTFENNVATHLTRILNSSDHSIVISSARFAVMLNLYLRTKKWLFSVMPMHLQKYDCFLLSSI